MDISKEEAKESLEQIQAASARMRKTIESAYVGPSLILWGVIWIAAFIGTHFFLARAFQIWMALDAVGIVGTFLICWRQFRTATPIKTHADRKIGWRIFWFWTLLFFYIFIWLSIMSPFTGRQCNAFICTTIMFAFVVKGLWLDSYYMLWLGLLVTCITMVGFYLIPPSYYCLWMAPTGGAAFLATGLYIRFRWR